MAAALLCAGVAGAAASSRASDWHPIPLVVLLIVLAHGSELMTLDMRGVRMSGSFLAFVLAMALLGPAPAVAISLSCAVVDAVLTRRSLDRALLNFAMYATYPLLGGLAIVAIAGAAPPDGDAAFGFSALVLIVFMFANALNFGMTAVLGAFAYSMRWRDLFRAFVLSLPSASATALLTAAVAFSYSRIGLASIALAAVVLFVFLNILRTSVQAQERGEELEQRTKELASLQVGLLTTVLQTLSMRDAMTARHSAAVARYSREVARMLGLSEREQDLIHTAALLHDIGKFILPDSVLFADRKLTSEEWELIKLHPEQGAMLVDRIEGYGPVAEIIMHHHERFSGGGYPAGIAGEAIPMGSRIISAADTYDVMTSRDSYRRPVSSEAALAELRRVAGTQLDPIVVEVFERMILEGRVKFSHDDEADFESELAFERRVAEYARPRVAA
ncbi:HD-GYP domain-containing protein [Candidatus Solirubrobacter pratensis]|uniref:HD-GYP domain-containing protein n=1 Tax=Candidatus Solirubrobacter pratensis TaxID=1298857 RepID=UPI0006868603|nr:HD domain-containing phosphohydrolase [Candidatus Solirubrobacter pratensis]